MICSYFEPFKLCESRVSILHYSMSIPVSQLTVEQVHKVFNSLADKREAKYEQLDSSEFRAVGTPAFNAKSAKLASLCLYELTMSKTEPANACTTSQAAFPQELKSTFLDLNCTGRQSYCVEDVALFQ